MKFVRPSGDMQPGGVYANSNGRLAVKIAGGGLAWLRRPSGTILVLDEILEEPEIGSDWTQVQPENGR